MTEKIKIGGELDPRTPEKILGDASTIKDRTWAENHPSVAQTPNQKQDEINEYFQDQIDNIVATEQGGIQTDAAPTEGSVKLVQSGGTYASIESAKTFSTGEKVPNVGIDGTPTANSDNLVKSGGVQNELALGAVYDVSAKNPTAGPNNDGKFESLSALLSDANLSTLIPSSVRKGGMSVKFVQSSDNKYVQFRYMSSSTAVADFTNVANWQGIDVEPTFGSDNLLESGGAVHAITRQLCNHKELFIPIDISKYNSLSYIPSSGGVWYGAGKHICIPVKAGDVITINGDANTANSSAYAWVITDVVGTPNTSVPFASGEKTRSVQNNVPTQIIAPSDARFLLLVTINGSNNPVSWVVNINGTNGKIFNTPKELFIYTTLELGTLDTNGSEYTSNESVRTIGYLPTDTSKLYIALYLHILKKVLPNFVHLGVNVHCFDANKTSLGRTTQGYQFLDKAGILEYDLREGTKFVRLTISPQIGDLTNYLDVLQGLDYISVFEDDKSYINSLIQNYRDFIRDFIVVDNVPTVGSDNLVKSGGIVDTLTRQLYNHKNTYISVDTSKYPTLNYIPANDKWHGVGKHICIPVNGGDIFTINGITENTDNSSYAWLTTDAVGAPDTSVPYATGETRRFIPNNTNFIIIAPSDAKFLLLVTITGSNTNCSWSVYMNGSVDKIFNTPKELFSVTTLQLGTINIDGTDYSTNENVRTKNYIPVDTSKLYVALYLDALNKSLPNFVHLGVNVHCYDINKTSLGRTAQDYQYLDKAGILEYDLREGTKFVRLSLAPQVGDLTNYLDVLQGLDYISVFEDDKSYICSLIQYYRDFIVADDEPTANSNNLVKSGGVYKKLSELNQFVGKKAQIDLTELSILNKIPTSGGVWYDSGKHICVPVNGNINYRIKPSKQGATTDSIFAWVTSDAIGTTGSAVPFSQGEGRRTAKNNVNIIVTAPTDAAFLLLVTTDGSGNNIIWEVEDCCSNNNLTKQVNTLGKEVNIGNFESGTITNEGATFSSSTSVRSHEFIKVGCKELNVCVFLEELQKHLENISFFAVAIHCFNYQKESLGRTLDGFKTLNETNGVLKYNLLANTEYIKIICFSYLGFSEDINVVNSYSFISVFEKGTSLLPVIIKKIEKTNIIQSGGNYTDIYPRFEKGNINWYGFDGNSMNFVRSVLYYDVSLIDDVKIRANESKISQIVSTAVETIIKVQCYDTNKGNLGSCIIGFQSVLNNDAIYHLLPGTAYIRFCAQFIDSNESGITLSDTQLNDINNNVEDIFSIVGICVSEKQVIKNTEFRQGFFANQAKGVFGIMQYNVGGWYNGAGEILSDGEQEIEFYKLQQTIIDRYAPDVLCIQEYANSVGFSNLHSIPKMLAERYVNVFAHPKNTYEGKCICTSQETDGEEFVTSDRWMNYQKAYIYCNGVRVCFVSTHLWPGETSIKTEDVEILLDALEGEPYVVICLDSNIDALIKNEDYELTLGKFEDAGYIVHNQTMVTVKSGKAIDNIITTKNIVKKSLVVDHQKDVLPFEDRDHYSLIGYFEIF